MHNDQMLIQILMHSGSEVFPCSTGLGHTACALCTECASMHVGHREHRENASAPIPAYCMLRIAVSLLHT